MKRLATRSQMQAIDSEAQLLGWDGTILMEAAASASSAAIQTIFYPELRRPGPVIIVCGPGNNGGDGYAVARHLHSAGFQRLLVLAVAKPTTELAQKQYRLCEGQQISLSDEWQPPQEEPTLIVDALFGVGLNREVTGVYREVIDWINAQSCPKVSLDTPSGLDANCGVVLGGAVKADQTITFGLAKPGFYLQDGPRHVGRLQVQPIGFPQSVLERHAHQYFLFDKESAQRVLPKREDTSNKSSHGHALIVAGSQGTWGAALLASESCFRTGVGLVTLVSSEDLKPLLAQFPEVMTLAGLDGLDWQRFSAIGVGPGLGPLAAQALKSLMKALPERVILDADAINCVAQSKLWPLPSTWTITPHAGELSRILGISAKEIEQDRLTAVQKAVGLLGCQVVLKGFHTVIGLPGAKTYVIDSGNSSLAKGGSGDVLTGIMTGLVAQPQLTIEQAVSLAVYVHGYSADRWVAEPASGRSFQPSDLIARLPQTFYELEQGL